MLMDAGTVATDVVALDSDTVTPPTGAAVGSVTVPDPEPPSGISGTLTEIGAPIVTIAVALSLAGFGSAGVEAVRSAVLLYGPTPSTTPDSVSVPDWLTVIVGMFQIPVTLL